jgi:hypothetical protein
MNWIANEAGEAAYSFSIALFLYKVTIVSAVKYTGNTRISISSHRNKATISERRKVREVCSKGDCIPAVVVTYCVSVPGYPVWNRYTL